MVMRSVLLAIGCMAFMGTSGQSASLLFDPTVSSCTGINCSSITVGGTVLNSAGLTPARWDVAIFANTNECLRLDEVVMSGAGADDEMVVVAPNGNVYRNDDFGGTTRPRVVIIPTPARGWYYVSIARFNGAPAPEHDLQFAFGRYTNNTANPNCASPTVAAAPASPAALKPEARPQPGSPDAPSGR